MEFTYTHTLSFNLITQLGCTRNNVLVEQQHSILRMNLCKLDFLFNLLRFLSRSLVLSSLSFARFLSLIFVFVCFFFFLLFYYPFFCFVLDRFRLRTEVDRLYFPPDHTMSDKYILFESRLPLVAPTIWKKFDKNFQHVFPRILFVFFFFFLLI